MEHRTVAALVALLLSPLAGGMPALAQAATGAVPVPRAASSRRWTASSAKWMSDKDKMLTKIEVEQFQRAVALAEAQARARTMFNQLDTDKNGQLSHRRVRQDGDRPPQPNAALVLGPSDLNRDGKVTLIEYPDRQARQFRPRWTPTRTALCRCPKCGRPD